MSQVLYSFGIAAAERHNGFGRAAVSGKNKEGRRDSRVDSGAKIESGGESVK